MAEQNAELERRRGALDRGGDPEGTTEEDRLGSSNAAAHLACIEFLDGQPDPAHVRTPTGS